MSDLLFFSVVKCGCVIMFYIDSLVGLNISNLMGFLKLLLNFFNNNQQICIGFGVKTDAK